MNRTTPAPTAAGLTGSQPATPAHLVRFADLPIGEAFRWQSNLGGQDTFLKTSNHDVLNMRTRNHYRVDAVTHGFGQADPVLPLIPQEAAK